MKRHLILLCTIIFLGTLSLHAQNEIIVSGTVTNEINGYPIADHNVYILINDSTIFYSTAVTNSSGYYIDTIFPAGYTINSLYIYTMDLCVYGVHDTIIQNPDSVVTADFQICVDSTSQNCQAAFNYYPDSINQSIIYFYDQSTPTGDITSWYWDFGDGTTSTLQNPIHAYNTMGTYNVCLTITALSGSCTSVYCENVISGGGGVNCDANFNAYIDSTQSNTVYFNDLSTPLGLIESWYWDFGDGNTSTQQYPTHTYSASGSYNVCLTITADSGICTSTECEVITLSGGGSNCTADFYYFADSTQTQTAYFYDLSTPSGLVESWYWDFGDGNTSTQQNPTHMYNSPGSFNVCLTITADSGTCTSTYCELIIVSGGVINCEADFTWDSAYAGNPVQFTDLSVSGIGQIVSWDWLFGDGSVSYIQNPTHTYNVPGTYTVCLTIVSQGMGMYCIDTTCYNIVVLPAIQQYQLGGNVFAGIYQLDLGFAYAYESVAGTITNVFSEMIDTLGYYQFYPMLSGDYITKAEPSPNSTFFGQYIPTYYGDVTSWDDAVLISLTQNVYTADINLVPVSQGMFGPGTIGGIIEHGSTNKAYTPAEDIQIMLIDDNGDYVGLVYSDSEGKFEFNSLDYGNYSIHAEVMGANMAPNEFTISEESTIIDDISLILTDDEIFFGPSSIETLGDITLSDVYPNPVRDNLKLDIGSKDPTTISVKIMNQLGQAMYFETIYLDRLQTLEISTDQLQPGMFFLEVISKDGYRSTRRFVKL